MLKNRKGKLILWILRWMTLVLIFFFCQESVSAICTYQIKKKNTQICEQNETQ